MKIRIYIKAPDEFYEGIHEAVCETLDPLKLSQREKDALYDMRAGEVKDALEKWVEYNECCTLEFDTEAGTATVLLVQP